MNPSQVQGQGELFAGRGRALVVMQIGWPIGTDLCGADQNSGAEQRRRQQGGKQSGESRGAFHNVLF